MNSVESMLHVFGGSKLPIILQAEAAECGMACLAMIANYHGLEIDLTALRKRISVSMKGMTLNNICDAAQVLGFNARALRLELEEIDALQTPAILHWRMNHFVVLKGKHGAGWTIHDPASGSCKVDRQELSEAFTGVALELTPSITFQPKRTIERLRLSQLWSKSVGLVRSLSQGLALSVVLQTWILASPFLLQIVIDDVLPHQDGDLLFVLCVGFGLFALVNALASALRQQLLLTVGNIIGFQLGTNVARHLLKLPITYFERRHAGDIISRFGGVQQIQSTLTSGVVASVIDGVMAVLILGLMLFYSPTLCLIAIVALTLQIILRVVLFNAMKMRNDSAIVAQANHDTYVIETVRGITPIRLYNLEGRRLARWQNRMASVVNARLGYGRLMILFNSGTEALTAVENVVSIFFAAKLVLSGGFSIGMVYAYLSYKGQFLGRATSLISRWLDFQMLDIYLRRLGDIAFANTDPAFRPSFRSEHVETLRGDLALRDIFYRYGDGEPWILRGLNLSISSGEHVALIGPSGCGKTTLIKIMLTLTPVTYGTLLIDGSTVEQYGYEQYRRQIAAVMQDDQLFAGSIADNICLFDPKPDTAWIEECAKSAAIHMEILSMPMRYETLVGDMGTALSGGQKQRILLARALYRRPRMLFMDEGTSHLDPLKEEMVNKAISEMGITRIVVAHRSETVRHADRVIELHQSQ